MPTPVALNDRAVWCCRQQQGGILHRTHEGWDGRCCQFCQSECVPIPFARHSQPMVLPARRRRYSAHRRRWTGLWTSSVVSGVFTPAAPRGQTTVLSARKRAGFGITHAMDGMVNVLSMRCAHPGCTTRPNYVVERRKGRSSAHANTDDSLSKTSGGNKRVRQAPAEVPVSPSPMGAPASESRKEHTTTDDDSFSGPDNATVKVEVGASANVFPMRDSRSEAAADERVIPAECGSCPKPEALVKLEVGVGSNFTMYDALSCCVPTACSSKSNLWL